MHDKLLEAVAESFRRAGYDASYSPGELRIGELRYRVRGYAVSLYIDSWRVPRVASRTAVRRIVERLLLQLPWKMQDVEYERQQRTEDERRERARALRSLAGVTWCTEVQALTLALLKTEQFVAAAPFVKALAEGDEFAAQALCDMLEDSGGCEELVVAVRRVWS